MGLLCFDCVTRTMLGRRHKTGTCTSFLTLEVPYLGCQNAEMTVKPSNCPDIFPEFVAVPTGKASIQINSVAE